MMRACAILLLVAGCGPGSADELALPRLELTEGETFCATVIVVDGEQGVWRHWECENDRSSWDRLGHVSTDSRAQLEALFDVTQRLPPGPCSRGRDSLDYRTYDGRRDPLGAGSVPLSFSTCTDDARPLAPEHRAFVDAMQSLVSR
jgi:hypothetical protein